MKVNNQSLAESYNRELKKIVRSLKKYRPQRIIAYGSIVSGNLHEGSDIDLLIIKDSSKSFPERIREVFEITGSTKVEPLVYTPEELDLRLKCRDFFLTKILKEGEVVYDASGSVS